MILWNCVQDIGPGPVQKKVPNHNSVVAVQCLCM
jgi:hypothetical protein